MPRSKKQMGRAKSGPHFDIGRPSGQSKSSSAFWRFILIALFIFIVLTVIGGVYRGKDLIDNSKEQAFTAFDQIETAIIAAGNREFDLADLWLKEAEKSIELLRQSIQPLMQEVPFTEKALIIKTADNLIESGISMTQIGQSTLELLQEARGLPEAWLAQQKDSKSLPVTNQIHRLEIKLEGIKKQIIAVQQHLTTLNEMILPESLKGHLIAAREGAAQIIALLNDLESDQKALLTLLGDKTPHRFLVMMQNSRELRAAGGFMGSYMLITINDGAITEFTMKDVYGTDGQMTKSIPAPPGIDRVATQLYMRDANYSPDFPTSAKEVMRLLELSQGPTVDTVIAIDETVAEALLRHIGPIQLESYSYEIDAERFTDLMSYLIETKSNAHDPKSVLFEAIPPIKEKLLEAASDWQALLEIIQELVRTRHIQAYSTHSEAQDLIFSLGLDGELLAPEKETDFLSLVTTSIGGNKSDRYIETQIIHETEVQADGKIMDTLKIEKAHQWSKSDQRHWQWFIDRFGLGEVSKETLLYIIGAGENKDYMRVYLPLGSKIKKLEGLEGKDITPSEDLGYRVVAFDFLVSAGETKSVSIQYELPYLISDSETDWYRFIVQKQAGARNQKLIKSLKTPESRPVTEHYPEAKSVFSIHPKVEMTLDENQIFLAEIGSKKSEQ